MMAAWSGAISDETVRNLRQAFSARPTGEDIREDGGMLAMPSVAVAARDGQACAFQGWIDNADDLARLLDMPAASPAALYLAAVARWAEGADARIHGSYAAIVTRPSGALRLARAPWAAPPLYFAKAQGCWLASPLLRVLFAGGVPREPDWEAILDELACVWPEGGAAPPFRGIEAVRLGSVVELAGGEARHHRWYAPPQPLAEAEWREPEAVEQAHALLGEAVDAARRWSSAPVLALSSGLDSSLVAATWAEQADRRARLDCLTFLPDRSWQGDAAPGTFGDDGPGVRALAQRHPALRCHFTTGDVGAFDREARAMQQSMQVLAPGLANVAMMHELYGQAKTLGARELWTADLGNTTFSNEGLPAYREYVRPGRFAQLCRLLANRAGDPRSMPRKLFALSVLPGLPRFLRRRLRALVHSETRDFVAHQTLLRRDVLGSRARSSAWADLTYPSTRAEEVALAHEAQEGRAADVHLAFEERYGIVRRDVTAYRPLIEFCLRQPTRAFAWNGVDRRLARCMGRGLLPEELRTNRLYGRHNTDWHERISADRDRLIETFRRARDHDRLSALYDFDRILGLLENWPASPPHGFHEDWPLRLGIPRALVAVRWVGMLEDRNDF